MLLDHICTDYVGCQLVETTISQLASATGSNFPTREETAGVRITKKFFVKYSDNQLLVRAICAGETADYRTNIVFEGVQYTQADDPQSIKLDREYIRPLSRDLDVRVSCTCQDFKWTFAWQNSNADALFGNPPPPYNASGKRPPRNPSNTIGICKHIVRLVDDLKAEQHFV